MVRRKTDESLGYRFKAVRCVLAVFHGVVEVLLYGRRETFLSEFGQSDLNYALCRAQASTLTAASPWILECLIFSVLAAAIAALLLQADLSLSRVTGTLALIGATAWRILPAANRCMSATLTIVAYRPYLKPFLENICEKEDMVRPFSFPEEQKEPLGLERSIVLEDISLTYPLADAPALSTISLTINKGEMVAFIGRSGAGKSTLVGVLTGLLAPSSGRLLLDGRELSPETACAWGKSLGYVPQTPYIMDATLAENVAFSEWGAPPDKGRVLAACRKAAIDFIGQLPQGLDTPLGEKGVRLSGGQAQRVVIARALFHNPDVIIFDEATSALDDETEKSIQETINDLRGRLTVILIAHRLSTVEACQRIFWLERGRLRMSGSASEVLAAYQPTMEKYGLE
jgi:ABC-type multidrug transport system fused ATPase/permease subunit